jgi:hypothetical protein
MATVTVNNTPTSTMPYAQELADIPALQVQNASIHDEYVNLTASSLSITTGVPLFINSGTGNDTIIDNSKTPGDVVIDPGGGTNTIQASSNPTSHDTIIVDAESDAPLIDVITGLKAGDNVLIKGLTALSPNDFTNATNGLMLTMHLPAATSPAAQIVLGGYTASDLAAGGRLSSTSFTPSSSMPEASPYLLLHVVR